VLGHLFSRFVRALDDWRERDRLRGELDLLERTGQLDDVLGEVGLTRAQIPDLMAARPGTAERLARMMAQAGVDQATLRAAGGAVDAAWRCQRCQHTEECETWLADRHAAGELPDFCPNKSTFEEIPAKWP
jgi:hypothetical protein